MATSSIHPWWRISVLSPRRTASSAFLALLLAWLGASAAADELAHGSSELKPFEASYTWVWHGMTVAVSSLHLEHQEGNKWVYRSKSEPRGLGHLFSERPIQESMLEVTDAGVRP